MFFQFFWAASHSLCGILLAKNVVRSHAGIMELDTSHQNIQCKCSSLPGARSWRTHAENWAAFQYRPAVAKNDSAPLPRRVRACVCYDQAKQEHNVTRLTSPTRRPSSFPPPFTFSFLAAPLSSFPLAPPSFLLPHSSFPFPPLSCPPSFPLSTTSLHSSSFPFSPYPFSLLPPSTHTFPFLVLSLLLASPARSAPCPSYPRRYTLLHKPNSPLLTPRVQLGRPRTSVSLSAEFFSAATCTLAIAESLTRIDQ